MVMPKISIDFIQKIDQEKYFELIKYQIISSYDLNCYLDVDEGIENKLKKTINEVNNLNDLILRVKSKRYSYSKIQRMLLHIVCKFKKSDNDLKLKYIRVLGLNDNGAKIIREVKKNINIPIITKYKKEYDDLFKIDKKANFIYSLLTDYDMASEFKSCIKK
jgi:predicted nucleotidyltransferase